MTNYKSKWDPPPRHGRWCNARCTRTGKITPLCDGIYTYTYKYSRLPNKRRASLTDSVVSSLGEFCLSQCFYWWMLASINCNLFGENMPTCKIALPLTWLLNIHTFATFGDICGKKLSHTVYEFYNMSTFVSLWQYVCVCSRISICATLMTAIFHLLPSV